MKKPKEPQSYNPLEAEIAIATLHASGNYRVLRSIDLDSDHRFTRRSQPDTAVAICLDTETTGLDQAEDRIIELGMVAFEYAPASGEIIRIVGRYAGFEDPGRPLAPEISEITGITDEMLRDQRFDDAAVARLEQQASLIIAHNAAFDRPFVEKRYPAFQEIPWACTVSQIDWQSQRLPARSLEYLLFKFGWCINAHRALDDAEGVLALLLESLPLSKEPVFPLLLAASAEDSSRICAVNAPYDKKDLLKQRGYRWSDGSNGIPKCWWIKLPAAREKDELRYLAEEIYPNGRTESVVIRRIDPLDRFSIREG